MFMSVARVKFYGSLDKAESTCPLDKDSDRFSHLFGIHSFALLYAAKRRKPEFASFPRFKFRLTITTLLIDSDEALLKQESEKTSHASDGAHWIGRGLSV
jgi:hypothetical protein